MGWYSVARLEGYCVSGLGARLGFCVLAFSRAMVYFEVALCFGGLSTQETKAWRACLPQEGKGDEAHQLETRAQQACDVDVCPGHPLGSHELDFSCAAGLCTQKAADMEHR